MAATLQRQSVTADDTYQQFLIGEPRRLQSINRVNLHSFFFFKKEQNEPERP
jgi:hypothetical protein